MNKDDARIPVRGVVPINEMAGGDAEDTRLLRAMASGAKDYLTRFAWCRKILGSYYGDGYGGIVAIFLFCIEPSRPDVDQWLWVVFGDVPPAYLVTESAKTPAQALERYIEEIDSWVELAKQSLSSAEVIPVAASATPENATDLERRMNCLRNVILPAFREAEAVRG